MRVAANIFILFSILLVQSIICSDTELTVRVKNGLLQGKYMETKNGRKILGFTGIPFAKPPVGELRFQPPVAMDNWDGIKIVTEIHPVCTQTNTFLRQDNIEGGEDCLYLSVYTPKIDIDELLPVMVYIHGGGYHTGSGILYTPEYLLDKDVVLVSINYRLGPFGFLTSGDEIVPGNMGMKDQTLALKWVQENIVNFGGNPKSVTIFGESAGGGSTHLQVLSPLSKGLFHASISQSGNALARWALQPLERGARLSKKLASIFNCPIDNSKEMIDCLRKVDAKEIIGVQKQFLTWDIDPPVVFIPVIEPKHDGAFLYETVENSLKQGLGSDVPWMTGITKDEGAIRSASVIEIPNLLNELNENLEENAHLFLFMDKSKVTTKIGKLVREFYFGKGDIVNSDLENLSNMYGDSYFLASVNKAIDLHKNYLKSPVYNYLFAYRGSMSFSEPFALGSTKDFGVSHCDDLLYLFPIQNFILPGKQPTQNDENMIEVLTTLWTNFAKYKNPTPNGSNTLWKTVDSSKNEYLHILDDQNLTMNKQMFKERLEFWKKIDKIIADGTMGKDEL